MFLARQVYVPFMLLLTELGRLCMRFSGAHSAFQVILQSGKQSAEHKMLSIPLPSVAV